MISRGSDERMLTTEEVARWLEVGTRTICTWAECNELPGVKVGRQWRFRRSAVAEWLEGPNRLQNGAAAASAATAAKAAYSSFRHGAINEP